MYKALFLPLSQQESNEKDVRCIVSGGAVDVLDNQTTVYSTKYLSS